MEDVVTVQVIGIQISESSNPGRVFFYCVRMNILPDDIMFDVIAVFP